MSIPFENRHIGTSESDVKEMLNTLDLENINQLTTQTIPSNILINKDLGIGEGISEHEYLNQLKEMISQNKNYRSFIGMGFYQTGTLPVVVRNIFENPSWYTSYTPYQAEISQGRLEALLNFQTMISSLTGFEIANSSMLDDSTAAAEAMRMMFELRSRSAQKEGKNKIFLDKNVFPQVAAVIQTRAEALGIEVEMGDYSQALFCDKCFGAIIQYPAANGEVRDYSSFTQKAHEKEILVTAVTDLLSLAILKEPAAWGADIAVGTAQRFGLPMGFGGPTAGFMATHDKYKRNLPGRIIGVSVDRLGNKALRMALQTREQHIKREKATSNICTATALMATMSGMYAVYHGPKGIRDIAKKIFNYANAIKSALLKRGYNISSTNIFDTIEIIGADVNIIKDRALEKKINLFYTDNGAIRFSIDELTTINDLNTLLDIFEVNDTIDSYILDSNPINNRESQYLTEATFNKFHSETELMRYIKKLERRDISLTHSMIPLGSCTMKLNAAVEMMPLSWGEINGAHPFTPADQMSGYMQLIKETETLLAKVTGFYACSLQPNSGAAGEYAGLMTIRAYHIDKGDSHRNVAIIPTSAHGTNPASAAMAGMEIVLVGCDEKGNIDVDQLREKAQEYKERLSCIMITYPSTHGVFEVRIKEIMDIIHENGGLVYMDGANMNAQVGLTNPGYIGADVCHLNLHKTFAMPHGGGGPGVGPICVTKELAQYLPCHPFIQECPNKGAKAISSAPYGFPMMLPITHSYIKCLGDSGLRKSTEVAILSANYISHRLKDYYTTLYTGENSRVAHECILDLRSFRKEYGVDATDVAKRLMDYGFHAPTLSFPVADTLMIEPTESESKAELDRFIDAMISIKKECEAIKSGAYDANDNPLKNAPHTALEVTSDTWDHKYSRAEASYPLEYIKENKFWPHVSRVDNGYGDRNLMCSCEGWIEN